MDLQPLVDAVRQKTGADIEIKDVLGVLFAATPDGVTLERLDIEPFLPKPKAIRRQVNAHDIRGFVDYTNKFKADATQLYCKSVSAPGLLARLDDHMPGDPSHVNHTAVYPCPQTIEWKSWFAYSGKAMAQKEFAIFLEKNQKDIVSPSGSEMLEMATNFRDVSSTEFTSTVRLDNNRVQLNYVQKGEAGAVQLPQTFTIAVPIFEGMDVRYSVVARLRWQTKEQALTLWYDLDRPDVVFRAAYDELIQRVEEETSLPVIRAE